MRSHLLPVLMSMFVKCQALNVFVVSKLKWKLHFLKKMVNNVLSIKTNLHNRMQEVYHI